MGSRVRQLAGKPLQWRPQMCRGLVLLGTAAVLSTGLPLLAGPFNNERVDRDARWVGHLDMEAALASAFGETIRSGYSNAVEHLQREHADDPVAEIFGSGFDFLRDIRGLTFYGYETGSSDCIMVLETTDAVDSLLAHLEEHIPGFERLSGELHPTYGWVERGELGEPGARKRYARVRAVPVPGAGGGEGERGLGGKPGRLVLVTHSRVDLERASAVLSGQAPTLASVEEHPLAALPKGGSLLFVAVDGVNLRGGREERVAMLSRLTSAMQMDIGQQGDEMYAEVSLTARDEREAAAMVQIIHGILAWAQMHALDDQDFQPVASILAGVVVDREGQRVTSRVKADAGEVSEALRTRLAPSFACDGGPGEEVGNEPDAER